MSVREKAIASLTALKDPVLKSIAITSSTGKTAYTMARLMNYSEEKSISCANLTSIRDSFGTNVFIWVLRNFQAIEYTYIVKTKLVPRLQILEAALGERLIVLLDYKLFLIDYLLRYKPPFVNFKFVVGEFVFVFRFEIGVNQKLNGRSFFSDARMYFSFYSTISGQLISANLKYYNLNLSDTWSFAFKLLESLILVIGTRDTFVDDSNYRKVPSVYNFLINYWSSADKKMIPLDLNSNPEIISAIQSKDIDLIKKIIAHCRQSLINQGADSLCLHWFDVESRIFLDSVHDKIANIQEV